MTVFPLQANMSRGEVTPYVHARADTEHYAAGVHTALNVFVLRYGGLARIPGTLFNGQAKNANKQFRFIPFEFNRSQVYAIEAGDLYFRLWTGAGRIESPPGVPVEIVTPYLEADLKYLRVRQSGDVIYIWCRKAAGGMHQPRTLTRNSETSWTLALHEITGGPFLKEDTQGTKLTPAETGAVHPIMTTNSAPSGTVTGTMDSTNAFRVFNASNSDVWSGEQTTATLTYDFPGTATKVCDAYWIRSNPSQSYSPSAWTFEGFDGTNWVALDSRQKETGWARGETRYYEFVNKTAYQSYRLVIEGSEDDGNLRISEMGWHESADTMTAFTLTASSVNGINDSTGFQSSDVGRVLRLKGGDGLWRTARIVTRSSTTVVTVVLYGHSLPNLSPITQWQLGALSNVTGWPAAGAVYEDRLFHASTPTDPLGIWGSVSADYDNHNVSTPVVADDAVSVRLTGGKLDDISWIAEMRDTLVVGTAGSLRAVGRNNDNEALGPANFRQRAQTLAPSSIAEPVTVENVLLFLDFYEQRLYEAAYTYEVDGYLAREASTLNEHLFAAGVAEIAYLSHPHKIIVGRRYDGKLIFFTYDREQKVAGGALVDIGGEVETILPLPGETGTDLWLGVKRVVDGVTVRYVERLAEFWRAAYTVQELPVYAACATMYNDPGTPLSVLDTGLDHLEGETVGVWADGRDIGNTVVTDGEITLPGGVEAGQIVVGLRMPWLIKTLRLSQIGNQDGSGLGRKVTVVEGFVDLLESAGVEIGSLYTQDLLRFEDEIEENPDDPVPLRDGMYSLAVDDSWSNNGVLVIKGDKMYPATIRAIQLSVDGEP